MSKFVNKEKKRNWKLINIYHNGVACIVVLFTVLIDLATVLKNITLEKILLMIALLVIIICLLLTTKYKQILDKFPNKELLSNIIDAWTTLGIFVFLVEKIFLQLIDISKYFSERILVIILLIILLCGGILSVSLIVRKKEWKYYVDP